MTNGSELPRIAVAPSWATTTTLELDSGTVHHRFESEFTFQAPTGSLSAPLVGQSIRLEVVDELQAIGTAGVTAIRKAPEVVLVEDNRIEIQSWSIEEARRLHAALTQALAVIDAAGGA